MAEGAGEGAEGNIELEEQGHQEAEPDLQHVEEDLNVLQIALGITATCRYNPVNTTIRNIMQRALSRRDPNLVSATEIHPTPGIRLTYVGFNDGLHLKTLNDIADGALIFTCYGSMVDARAITLDKRMIKTPIGAIIDGTRESSLWVLIQESCQPNCKLYHCFFKNETGVVTYKCFAQASCHIPAQDLLRIHPSDLRDDPNYTIKNCDCRHPNCVSAVKEIVCTVENCKRKGKPFKKERDLAGHITKEHSGKPPVPDSEYWYCPQPECVAKKRKSKILKKNQNNIDRHNRDIHGIDKNGMPIEKRSFPCDHCGHDYTRENDYNRHFEESVSGCKGLNREQASQPVQNPTGTLKAKLSYRTKTQGFDVVPLPIQGPPPAPKKRGPMSRLVRKYNNVCNEDASSVASGSTANDQSSVSSSASPSRPRPPSTTTTNQSTPQQRPVTPSPISLDQEPPETSPPASPTCSERSNAKDKDKE